MAQAEAVEQLADRLARPEGHVLLHRQVREERVLLEDVAHRALLGLEEHAALGVEPDLVAERDAAAPRAHQAGDGAQDRRLAGARRPDQRQRVARLYAEVGANGKVAERDVDVEMERVHALSSLTVRRMAALNTTSSAPRARAVSKSDSNTW